VVATDLPKDPSGTACAPVAVTQIVCEHCDMLLRGKAYRVSSEENGVALLDLIVCEACRSQAQALGLRIEEVGILNTA
jgi:hypothetical protein